MGSSAQKTVKKSLPTYIVVCMVVGFLSHCAGKEEQTKRNEWDSSQAPTKVTGSQLVSYDDATVDCASKYLGPGHYKVNCVVAALQSDGSKIPGTELAPGLTIEWQPFQVSNGELKEPPICSSNALSSTCEIKSTEIELIVSTELIVKTSNKQRSETGQVAPVGTNEVVIKWFRENAPYDNTAETIHLDNLNYIGMSSRTIDFNYVAEFRFQSKPEWLIAGVLFKSASPNKISIIPGNSANVHAFATDFLETATGGGLSITFPEKITKLNFEIGSVPNSSTQPTYSIEVDGVEIEKISVGPVTGEPVSVSIEIK